MRVSGDGVYEAESPCLCEKSLRSIKHWYRGMQDLPAELPGKWVTQNGSQNSMDKSQYNERCKFWYEMFGDAGLS